MTEKEEAQKTIQEYLSAIRNMLSECKRISCEQGVSFELSLDDEHRFRFPPSYGTLSPPKPHWAFEEWYPSQEEWNDSGCTF